MNATKEVAKIKPGKNLPLNGILTCDFYVISAVLERLMSYQDNWELVSALVLSLCTLRWRREARSQL